MLDKIKEPITVLSAFTAIDEAVGLSENKENITKAATRFSSLSGAAGEPNAEKFWLLFILVNNL